jgi:hypothetical protein
MRKILGVAGLATLFLLAGTGSFASPPQAAKSGAGTIVIVFKDGHKQSFNLADIARMEFPGAAVADAIEPGGFLPSRGHFLGKWECGDGNGGTFSITLKEGGEAWRSIGDMRGKWDYIDGEARITWEDGKLDAIRKVGSRYLKFAYDRGKSFTDDPDNVAHALKSVEKPI